jgi:AraC family transcriptional regulator of adaptative response/methylated-DNA-[protein]-cysteine methyltransferase
MMAMPKRPKASAKKPSGLGEFIRHAMGESTLGSVLVASSDKGVVSILIGEDPDQLARNLRRRFPDAHIIDGDRNDRALVKRVVDFIERPSRGLDLPLDVRGTAFQQKVWQALQKIPAGKTSTYADIARKVGAPRAVRAVGNACSNNNLAIAIPCHRVLHSDGSLSGGYHWGTIRQGELLGRESGGETKKSKSMGKR